MAENTGGSLDLGENGLVRFLARTKEGEYALIDERPLQGLRTAAYAVITEDSVYQCSLS